MADILPIKASAKILDYAGLGLILAAIEITAQEYIEQASISVSHWERAGILAALGIGCLIVGTWWEKVKPGAAAKLTSLDAIANNPVSWLIVAGIIILGVPPLFGQTSSLTFFNVAAFVTMAALMIVFRAHADNSIRKGVEIPVAISADEKTYRAELRKFVLSNLSETLSAYLSVMAVIRDRCQKLANGFPNEVYWFADIAVHRSLRRQFAELEQKAKDDFADIPTNNINQLVLSFLCEYEFMSGFPVIIEKDASLDPSPREEWDQAHTRCRAALLDLRASPQLSGPLGGEAAITALKVPPSKRT